MLNKLLNLLLAVAYLLRLAQRQTEEKAHAEEVDAIRANPGSWFVRHFSRVRESTEMPGDAAETDKAGDEQRQGDV